MLQGGEDPYFTDERICAIVSAIKERYPDCAVTLSIGEARRRPPTAPIMRRGQTAIFCGTKRRTVGITRVCIRRKCALNTAMQCLCEY